MRYQLTPRERIYKIIDLERVLQDQQWGGPSHDDDHINVDWLFFISKQAHLGKQHPIEARERLVKIAALAIAGIESIDRKRSIL